MTKQSALIVGIVGGLFVGNSELSAESLHCLPEWPEFCSNLHVGCAGRSSVPTVDFQVDLRDQAANVVFDDGLVWSAAVSEAKGDRVLRQPETDNWIRIDKAGQFSHRIYNGATALMSVGYCRRLPDPDNSAPGASEW